jgi:hypothetical protein
MGKHGGRWTVALLDGGRRARLGYINQIMKGNANYLHSPS